MPRQGKGPRLWLRPARRGAGGRITHAAGWVIRDGSRQVGTGCGQDRLADAERQLAEYIATKHVTAATKGERRPAQIPVADILFVYARDVVGRHARPREAMARLERLIDAIGDRMLADVNGSLCRAYAEERGSAAAARRELEDLRAAINHYHAEGLCSAVVKVTLPARRPSRERWLSRSEAARLLWAAWRYHEQQKGRPTDRTSRRHVARFILVALYTGTRAGAVCGASFVRAETRGWIDLDRGVFHRRPAAKLETKKRQPVVRLPARLLPHLRRWQRLGAASPVEWNGAPVGRMAKAFRRTAEDAGLPDVTPHVLRHTAATWLMQNKADPWEAAGFLGMSVDILIRVYGHHHPAYQASAAEAIGRRPGRAGPPQIPPQHTVNEP